MSTSQQQMFAELHAKYAAERDKRLRADGVNQYIDLSQSEQFRHFRSDPWVHQEVQPQTQGPILENGSQIEYLILGAGWGGILSAVRLVQNGVKPEDIRFVDQAGGFGGTWYWNRYPGLMCDVESYLYLPLLEEMGYMPKHKYSYGQEIREYINAIIDKYNLRASGFFSTTVHSLTWNEQEMKWIAKMTHEKPGEAPQQMDVHARFVYSASGVLNWPKIPNIPGIDKFKGHIFHTARWDYEYTGGRQDQPDLTKLKGKRVGIIGTGATAIQVVPELAKWVDKLYVFQRTPSSVDERGQRPTDDAWYKQISAQPNWQRERSSNFHGFICSGVDGAPSHNMVDDGWTKMPSYRALIGGPNSPASLEAIPAYVGSLHALDAPRQHRIRERVDQVVKDPETADKLKPWYPGFCKRPCFHDEYLPTFNQPQVQLVDTNGKGVDHFTESSIVVDGQEYPVDCLILSTGFRSPGQDSPAGRANLTIIGRNGKNMDDKFKEEWSSLHGLISRDFPNLFLFTVFQGGASVNFSFCLDQLAQHAAHMIVQAKAKAHSDQISIEPTHQAEQQWSMHCMMRAGAMAAMSGCTPSYINSEGANDRMTMQERMAKARLAPWGDGIEAYLKVLEEWRNADALEDLEIKVKDDASV